MGCPCSLQFEASADAAQHAFDATRRECERLDLKYSHYRDDSSIAAIAADASHGRATQVDDETANLLDFAAELHRQSDGLFDITAGPLTRLWDLQSNRIPSQSEIDAARANIGWDRVEWQRPMLRLADGMRFDLGGIVKEYAADRCAQICRDAGVHHGIIDLGGDLALIGAHVNGDAWNVGIRSPRISGQAAASIALSHGGLATSGDYERVMIIDGNRYSHIVDPRSGWPVEGLASVSVLAESCLVAGAAATMAMLMGNEGTAWLRALGAPFLCIDTQGNMTGSIATS